MQPTAASPAGLPASFRRWSKLPVPARRIVVEVRRWSHPARRPHPTVAVEMVDGVAVMTFDDGKVNAISARMTQLLSDALDGLETSDARALVLAGRERRPPRPARARRMEPPVAHLRPAPARRCRVHRQHHRRRGRLLLLTDVRLGADGAFKIGFSEASIGILPLPGAVMMLARDRLAETGVEEALQGGEDLRSGRCPRRRALGSCRRTHGAPRPRYQRSARARGQHRLLPPRQAGTRRPSRRPHAPPAHRGHRTPEPPQHLNGRRRTPGATPTPTGDSTMSPHVAVRSSSDGRPGLRLRGGSPGPPRLGR
jgi:hypothetical protein